MDLQAALKETLLSEFGKSWAKEIWRKKSQKLPVIEVNSRGEAQIHSSGLGDQAMQEFYSRQSKRLTCPMYSQVR